jgi:hypothetical protein
MLLFFVAVWFNYRPATEPVADADVLPIQSLDVIEPQNVASETLNHIVPRNRYAGELNAIPSDDVVVVQIPKRNDPGVTAMNQIRAEETALDLNGIQFDAVPAIAAKSNYLLNAEQDEPVDTEETSTSFAARFAGGVFTKFFGSGAKNRKTLLEYTVDGYNLMSDREVDVEKEMDSSGNVIAYRINGEVLKVGHKVQSGFVE